MLKTSISIFFVTALWGGLLTAAEPEPNNKISLQESFDEAFAKRDFAAAERAATFMIQKNGQPLGYGLRAKAFLAQDKFAEAAKDIAKVVEFNPSAEAINYLGTIRYQAGQIKEALADFDRAIKLEPTLEAGHWQRGIVYYDLGQWENGRKQFEQYQGVDDNDVENVVWRAMCMARDPKLGWEKAAGDLWKVKHDRRVPLMVVHQLFADKATEADVLKAVDEGNPGEEELLSRRFYAHLYLGLYHEVRGNKAEALKHLELAAGKYKLPGYMAEVARLHAGMLKEKK